MSIQLSAITHRFGSHQVLSDISLSLNDGEILCVIGPSGSGKSTLLRIAAGLEEIQSGEIRLDGQQLASTGLCPPPEQRPVGLVFQDHALFPHLTVAQNVGFGLQEIPPAERDSQVNELLNSVGLVDLAARYPDTLSGGQQQRIALIRALATNPRVMLLDEPFASVDTPLRRELRQDARRGLIQAGTSTIMVTHDPEEAMAMADRILVLVDGVAVQLDTPQALWKNPAHRFIAETIAGLQSLTGQVEGHHIVTTFGNLPIANLRSNGNLTSGETVELGIRGSTITAARFENEGDDTHPARTRKTHAIEDIRFDGQYWTALVRSEHQQLRIVLNPEHRLRPGDRVELRFTNAEAVAYN
ncbi:MAG: ABC transporter ATP-binding protein [Pseudomonadales bacterium]|jgi:iron(III) transport system ATP-binding protein|nr:ABC transporter ATP-binding protein [Pseudomonadales bacterium]RPG30077.1 MAG: ABC transporter ATP-binding protein [Gammaproteobacteria bacterium TMED243]